MEWKQYRSIQIVDMRPYEVAEELINIHISTENRRNGSPKIGDMVARNPKNHADKWIVEEKDFTNNFTIFDKQKEQSIHTVYIAGPMTGFPRNNFPAFFEAEEFLQSLGFKTLNPARMCESFLPQEVLSGQKELNPSQLKRVVEQDIEAVMEADAVVLLDDWEKSVVGVKAELAVADWLKKPVCNIEDVYLLKRYPDIKLPGRRTKKFKWIRCLLSFILKKPLHQLPTASAIRKYGILIGSHEDEMFKFRGYEYLIYEYQGCQFNVYEDSVVTLRN